ncbi:MAG TPA: LppX_LprAFG lipoprotein [Dehalococcoidia bacterium]|nr:LppX_LprAFG lipoprotein [Dehalococcoidia bacterium]
MKWLLSLLLAATLAVACSGGGDKGDATDVAKLLDEAQAATAKVRSFHFKLSHENGTTPIILNLGLDSAEGDYVVPDALQAKVKAKQGPIGVSVEVISTGGRTWITNPFTGRWQSLADTRLSDFVDPSKLVTVLLENLGDARIEKQTEIDGAQTYEVHGSVDAGELEDGLPVAEPGQPVNVVVWIGVDDKLPRRARIKGRLSSLEDDDIVRIIDVSRFDESVEIKPPA